MKMPQPVPLATAAIALFCVAAAHAAPVISASTSPLFPLADLSWLATLGNPGFQNSAPISFAGGTITFVNSSGQPNAGVYQGSVIGVALTPYPGAAPTPDQRNYLVAQSSNNIVFQFDEAQTSFDMLWGTVDSYNSLEFQIGGQTITGADVAAAAGVSPNRTIPLYVSLSDLDPFQTLTVIDIGQPAFELVPAASLFLVSLPARVDSLPEPASLTVVMCGLMGLVAVRARRAERRTRVENEKPLAEPAT